MSTEQPQPPRTWWASHLSRHYANNLLKAVQRTAHEVLPIDTVLDTPALIRNWRDAITPDAFQFLLNEELLAKLRPGACSCADVEDLAVRLLVREIQMYLRHGIEARAKELGMETDARRAAALPRPVAIVTFRPIAVPDLYMGVTATTGSWVLHDCRVVAYADGFTPWASADGLPHELVARHRTALEQVAYDVAAYHMGGTNCTDDMADAARAVAPALVPLLEQQPAGEFALPGNRVGQLLEAAAGVRRARP